MPVKLLLHHIILTFVYMAVVTILHEILSIVRQLPSFGRSRDLSIQFDGASENWNQTVLAWCHLLVASRAFDRVTIYRGCLEPVYHAVWDVVMILCDEYAGLPPGHTHEDIDSLFSVIKQALIGRRNVSQGTTAIIIRTVSALISFLKSDVFTGKSTTRVLR